MSIEPVKTSGNHRAIFNYVVLPIIIPTCCILVFVMGFVFGWDNELQRFIRSFDFPAINARHEPFAEILKTATPDIQLNETRRIANFATTITHPDYYSGCVAGRVTRIFGTNRSFADVLADFVKFFRAKPEWKPAAWSGSPPTFYEVEAQTSTTRVNVEVVPLEKYAESWAVYKTVYEVEFTYIEPGGCTGR